MSESKLILNEIVKALFFINLKVTNFHPAIVTNFQICNIYTCLFVTYIISKLCMSLAPHSVVPVAGHARAGAAPGLRVQGGERGAARRLAHGAQAAAGAPRAPHTG